MKTNWEGWEKYKSIVEGNAIDTAKRSCYKVPPEDAIQIGWCAFYQCASRKKEGNFEAYLTTRVKGAVNDAVRKTGIRRRSGFEDIKYTPIEDTCLVAQGNDTDLLLSEVIDLVKKAGLYEIFESKYILGYTEIETTEKLNISIMDYRVAVRGIKDIVRLVI